MLHGVIKELQNNACPSIRYRLNKEILNREESFETYLNQIHDDKRVQYVLSLQGPDGYLGGVFHGGWIPAEKRKYSSAGAESALRFLAEMGFPKEDHVIQNALKPLLNVDWDRGKGNWTIFCPELGLFGDDLVRATVFSYFGIEDYDFIQCELERTFVCLKKVLDVKSINDIIEPYRGKNIYKPGAALPWSYHLRLLGFTQSWKTSENINILAQAVNHLIHLSPFPEIHIKYKSQIIAGANIFPKDLKRSLMEFGDKDWFPWFHTFELFARMGIVKRIPALIRQLSELQEILTQGDGFFRIKPDDYCFNKWSVYIGLALEEDWKNDRWMYDLAFRSLLILKYSGEI